MTIWIGISDYIKFEVHTENSLVKEASETLGSLFYFRRIDWLQAESIKAVKGTHAASPLPLSLGSKSNIYVQQILCRCRLSRFEK